MPTCLCSGFYTELVSLLNWNLSNSVWLSKNLTPLTLFVDSHCHSHANTFKRIYQMEKCFPNIALQWSHLCTNLIRCDWIKWERALTRRNSVSWTRPVWSNYSTAHKQLNARSHNYLLTEFNFPSSQTKRWLPWRFCTSKLNGDYLDDSVLPN